MSTPDPYTMTHDRSDSRSIVFEGPKVTRAGRLMHVKCKDYTTVRCNLSILHKNCIIIIIMALHPFVEPWPLFQFLNPIHSR
jgi:hypothetical protein